MRWEQRVTHSARTDVGLRRKNNEDAFVAHPATEAEDWSHRGHVFIVADGMGGHAVGELASKIAVETVSHILLKQKAPPPEALRTAITTANETIHSRGQHNRDFDRMGTTCSTLVLGPHGAFVGHVGDSRCYRIRRDRVDQLTFDHSLDWEYRQRFPGKKDDSFLKSNKNVITRSLGPEANVRVDVEGPFPIYPGDRYLLCSDGLTGLVSDEEIGACVRALPVDVATRVLIDLANLRGGNDNCTVIIADVGELPPGLEPTMLEIDSPARTWSLSLPLVAGYLAVIFFLALGFGSWLAGRPIAGAMLIALAGGGLIPLTVGTMRSREKQLGDFDSDMRDRSKTIHNRPHATAIALNPAELAADLASADVELSRTAREDSWPVDWTKHNAAREAATKAAEQKRFPTAIEQYGAAIHEIMVALAEVRAGGARVAAK